MIKHNEIKSLLEYTDIKNYHSELSSEIIDNNNNELLIELWTNYISKTSSFRVKYMRYLYMNGYLMD
jgi:hypothetical protein